MARHLTGVKGRLDLSYPFAVGESGHVEASLTARIGAMSYAEGRALGLSKAGLWDMKRRAAEGKPVRLYGKVARRLSTVSAEH